MVAVCAFAFQKFTLVERWLPCKLNSLWAEYWLELAEVSTYRGFVNKSMVMVNFPNALEEKMIFLLLGFSPTDETTPNLE